eukprot:COSAG02_NODE_4118_length_5752_cov_29.556342_3_plen_141_part_00
MIEPAYSTRKFLAMIVRVFINDNALQQILSSRSTSDTIPGEFSFMQSYNYNYNLLQVLTVLPFKRGLRPISSLPRHAAPSTSHQALRGSRIRTQTMTPAWPCSVSVMQSQLSWILYWKIVRDDTSFNGMSIKHERQRYTR